MRTCYRRELKRYIQSDRSGAGAEDLYAPSLWYFDQFSFLRDLEVPLSGRSNLSSEEEEKLTSPFNNKHQQNRNIPKKSCAVDLRTEFLKKASQHLESSAKDATAIYASGWACTIREMKPEQQLFAKQAIDEIVLLGRMDKLSLNYLQNVNSSVVCTSQNLVEGSMSSSGSSRFKNLSETSTQFSGIVGSPHLTSARLINRQYNSVFELLSDTQYQ